MNKNVADYTNFEGKTNKRIVQSPGGLSSISLGWGNEPVNQVERRAGKGKQYVPPSNYGGSTNSNRHYSEKRMNYDPLQMKLLDVQGQGNSYSTNQRNETYNYGKEKAQNRNIGGPIGGEYGYNNYSNKILQPDSNYQNYKQPQNSKYLQPNSTYDSPNKSPIYKPSIAYDAQDQLDYALQQERNKIQSSRKQRNQPPKKSIDQSHWSHQSQQSFQSKDRACIKFRQAPKSNMSLGGDYNYWKQDGYGIKPNIPRSNNNQRKYQQQSNVNVNVERTSVKVHNPPGGKSNFTFG